jgi:putative endonuclease
VTSNLKKRASQHKEKLIDGFTKKYEIDRLVYFEDTTNIELAIIKEKQLKKWNRAWKIRLIEETNPTWEDLYDKIYRIGWIPAYAGMTYFERRCDARTARSGNN